VRVQNAATPALPQPARLDQGWADYRLAILSPFRRVFLETQAGHGPSNELTDKVNVRAAFKSRDCQ
jgi:hypothetical protein